MIGRLFRTATVIAAFLVAAPAVRAATWSIDPAHSSVTFTIRHMGLARVSGEFKSYDGRIEFDGEHLEKGTVTFEIDAASIDTDNDKRDDHLRSADFFEVEKYPKILFKSTAVKMQDDGFVLEGRLSMHGKEQAVKLQCQMFGPIDDSWGNRRVGFEAEVTLQRENWGVGWGEAKLQPPLIGNDVNITINLELVKKS